VKKVARKEELRERSSMKNNNVKGTATRKERQHPKSSNVRGMTTCKEQ